MVLHGKEKEAAEDVWGIGKAIGLQFEGDTHNMFGALARKGSGKREGGAVRLVVRDRCWGESV